MEISPSRQCKFLTIEARHTLSLQESKKKRQRFEKSLFLPNNKQRKELKRFLLSKQNKPIKFNKRLSLNKASAKQSSKKPLSGEKKSDKYSEYQQIQEMPINDELFDKEKWCVSKTSTKSLIKMVFTKSDNESETDNANEKLEQQRLLMESTIVGNANSVTEDLEPNDYINEHINIDLTSQSSSVEESDSMKPSVSSEINKTHTPNSCLNDETVVFNTNESIQSKKESIEALISFRNFKYKVFPQPIQSNAPSIHQDESVVEVQPDTTASASDQETTQVALNIVQATQFEEVGHRTDGIAGGHVSTQSAPNFLITHHEVILPNNYDEAMNSLGRIQSAGIFNSHMANVPNSSSACSQTINDQIKHKPKKQSKKPYSKKPKVPVSSSQQIESNNQLHLNSRNQNQHQHQAMSNNLNNQSPYNSRNENQFPQQVQENNQFHQTLFNPIINGNSTFEDAQQQNMVTNNIPNNWNSQHMTQADSTSQHYSYAPKTSSSSVPINCNQPYFYEASPRGFHQYTNAPKTSSSSDPLNCNQPYYYEASPRGYNQYTPTHLKPPLQLQPQHSLNVVNTNSWFNERIRQTRPKNLNTSSSSLMRTQDSVGSAGIGSIDLQAWTRARSEQTANEKRIAKLEKLVREQRENYKSLINTFATIGVRAFAPSPSPSPAPMASQIAPTMSIPMASSRSLHTWQQTQTNSPIAGNVAPLSSVHVPDSSSFWSPIHTHNSIETNNSRSQHWNSPANDRECYLRRQDYTMYSPSRTFHYADSTTGRTPRTTHNNNSRPHQPHQPHQPNEHFQHIYNPNFLPNFYNHPSDKR